MERNERLLDIRTEALMMGQDKEVLNMLIQEKYDRMDWVTYGNERESKGIDKTRLESIKTVMKKLAYTSQQAVDFLDIPKKDQSRYAVEL